MGQIKEIQGKKKRPRLRLSAEKTAQLMEARKQARRRRDILYLNRLRAVLLVGRDGKSAREAAEVCEVHPRTVEYWIHFYRKGGLKGLQPGKPPGKRPRLTKEQKQELASWIEAGPLACNFDSGVWTAGMVIDMITTRFGITYSSCQVRRILHQLGFSIQYPRRKLALADHKAQAKWLRETLPEIKKTPLRLRG